jgi:hypothetical protein
MDITQSRVMVQAKRSEPMALDEIRPRPFNTPMVIHVARYETIAARR